jgi:hypothetical protein
MQLKALSIFIQFQCLTFSCGAISNWVPLLYFQSSVNSANYDVLVSYISNEITTRLEKAVFKTVFNRVRNHDHHDVLLAFVLRTNPWSDISSWVYCESIMSRMTAMYSDVSRRFWALGGRRAGTACHDWYVFLYFLWWMLCLWVDAHVPESFLVSFGTRWDCLLPPIFFT